MSRDDNLDLDWHDVKEEGGIKYIECDWESPAPSPAPSPRAMQPLATALQAALADPVKMQKLTALLAPPPEKKEIITPLPATEIPLPPYPRTRAVKRRVHGAL